MIKYIILFLFTFAPYYAFSVSTQVDVFAESNKGRWLYAGALLFFFKTAEEALEWFDPMNIKYVSGYWAHRIEWLF